MANNIYFHAEANALSGKLNLPFQEEIKKQAHVKLEGHSHKLLLEGEESRRLKERKAQDNYLSQHAMNFRLEGIISYSAAHTQVSGHRSKQHPEAFVTLATSYVENLNVLNVVTADRVVAQISTTHFPHQRSPEVTFLGTHFENLRIAGHNTETLLNLAFAGDAPRGRDAYYPTRGTDLMESVERQYRRMRDSVKRLKPADREAMRLDVGDSWLSSQYHGFANFDYENLQEAARLAAAKGAKWDGVTCSLAEHVEIEDIEIPMRDAEPIVIPPPVRSFGHVIHVPDFGTIFLAELKVNHNSFHLNMIRLEMDGIVDGRVSIVTCYANGLGTSGGAGDAGTDDLTGIDAASAATRSATELAGAETEPVVRQEAEREKKKGGSAESRGRTGRPPRYANTTLFVASDDPLVKLQPLNPKSSLMLYHVVHLRLDIGPLSPESQVTPAFPDQYIPPFPDAKLPADVNLDVMVSSNDFAVASDFAVAVKMLGARGARAMIGHGRFLLPGNGGRATTPNGEHFLSFYLVTPDQPGRAYCRIGYYYRNNLVQSQQLVANVGQPGGFELKTDFTLSADLTNLESFPERPRISILTNDNGDGTHHIVLRKPGTPSDPTVRGEAFSVVEKNIGKTVDSLRAALRDRAPTGRHRSRAELQEDLIQLAPKGFRLWTQVPGQHPQMFLPLLKDPASHVVQVSRPTTSGFVFPWSLIYDIPLNADNPSFCKLITNWDGQNALVSGSPRQCPHGPHKEDVLCPFGFWGFRYSIDQLSSTKDSVFSIPAPDKWDFVIAETQYAIDIRALSNHVQQLSTAIRKRFPGAQIREGKSKEAIRRLLGRDLPVVYFYCHGEKSYDADPDTYLGVGKNESIKATEFQGWVQTWLTEEKLIWDKVRPLVFVNACHSLEIHPETLVSYLDAFVGTARAAGVIGTEAKINQDLAMKVAERFFDLLLGQQKTVDEALRTIRLDYLADGNLLGLFYTPYCWSELCVV